MDEFDNICCVAKTFCDLNKFDNNLKISIWKSVRKCLYERKPFSQDLLFISWFFGMENDIFNTLMDICDKLLNPPVKKSIWSWFKRYVLDSLVYIFLFFFFLNI